MLGLLVPYVRVQATTSPNSAAGSSALALGASSKAKTGAAATSTTIATPSGSTQSAGSAATATAGSHSASSAGAAVAGTHASGSTASTSNSPITLGIGIINVGEASQFGYNFDIGNEQARYQALVDNINNAGGVNGHKIVPDFQTFNAVDPTVSAQAACVAWTQTDHVFAVLVESQFPTAGEVCVLQAGIPYITTQGTDESYYANGLFFSLEASDNRTLEDEANFLAGNGSLSGKTIGVVSGDGTDELSVDNTLEPALKQLGYQVKDVEVIPDSTSGAQQIPIAISNLKAAGVDFVIFAANVVLDGPFVQAANQAGYNPQYALSDFNDEINDQVASYYPSAFQGTIGLSTHRFPEYRAGAPFAPADQTCLNIVHPVDPSVLPTTNSAFEVAMGDCAVFDAFVAGAKAAGNNLTLSSWLAGMNSLGSFAIPGTQNGSFSAAKHDAADYEQEVSWQQSCTCWELVNGLSTPLRQLQGS